MEGSDGAQNGAHLEQPEADGSKHAPAGHL